MTVTDEERARRRAVMKAAGERARARSEETDRIVAGRARWMCEPYRAEGRGQCPETCPECGASGGWMVICSGDPRSMSEIFEELLDFLAANKRKPS